MKKLIALFIIASVTKLAAQPVAPTLVSPANGATNVSLPTSLDWNDVTGATSYRLHVSTSADFSTTVYDQSGLVGSSKSVSGLLNLTTYYWRVNATDSLGTSAWSSVWSFTTVALLPPSLLSPSNGATNVSTSPFLDWSSPSGATSYRLQVSTISDFSTTVFDQSGITTSSKSMSGLANGMRYYWRVNASNAEGTTDWSTVWSFTTLMSAPKLVFPANKAEDVSLTPTLRWNTATGATSYRLQVSTSSTFSTTVFDQSGITDTSQSISGLSSLTRYFWRVNATYASGTSGWSTRWDFRTVPLPPATPTLVSPANGATNVSTSLTLDWSRPSGTDSFRLQVSTSSDFSSTVFDQSGITSSYKSISGLLTSTTYYWRVNATNAGGTSGWSSVWSFTTVLPPPPAAPTLVSPSNGATDVSTSPTLTWNASSGATSYTVQWSTDSTFAVTSSATGSSTSSALTGLSNSTTYYWRVNATNAGGTSNWSTVWSFTTVPPAPAAPTLASPADASTNQSTSPTLSWNASTGASSYRLQISTSSLFTTTIFDSSGITSTSQAISGLLTSTMYYWRVNATNAGGTSNWSAVRSFTTVPSAPAAPVLASPVDGATNVATSPTLSWNASTGASSYRLQISTSSLFTTTIFDSSGITSTSQAISGPSASTTYYWRVNATNAAGTSGWSTVWSFTTVPPAPGVPTLVSPADGTNNVITLPLLSWNRSSGASSYRLQVSTSLSFVSPIFDQSAITDTSQYVFGLSNSTLYYWRVNATNSAGTSNWSTVWSFTTAPPPPPPPPEAPSLAMPNDGAIDILKSTTLSWNASTGATSYQLQVSTSPLFLTTVFDQSGVTGTSQTVSGLLDSTTYYWRVRATNEGGTGVWSTVWSFRTVPPAPIAQTLASPADGATNVSTSLRLSWNSSSGANTYRVQVSTNSSFAAMLLDQGGITSTSKAIGGLSGLTTYYWRANASNAGGTSGWSTLSSFTTLLPIPEAPILVFPANVVSNVSVSPSLAWGTSSGATSYTVQWSTNSTFTEANSASSSSTSYTPTGLSRSTIYYWRVRAENTSGTSGWSQIRSFTTVPASPSVPTLAFPADGAINVSASPTLNWNSSSGATTYVAHWSVSSSFVNADSVVTSSTSSVLSALPRSTTYYWRVRAENAGGTSLWSAVRSFTTVPLQPIMPTPIAPCN